MKKVLIPTKLDKIAGELLVKNGSYEVVQDDECGIDQLAEKHPDAYALIVRSEKVTAEVIDALPGLKVIVRAGAGYNTIDTKYARKKRIDVMNTPGANSNAVAEEVIAMMLADARYLLPADSSTRLGKWEKKKFMGREIAEKTIGIVGLGNIGQLVAKRLMGFDVRLLGYDPIIAADRAAELNVSLADLETVFSESDYVTLHIPENEDTRGLVGKKLLEKMKDGATIVNCARAGIIDEDAVREAKEKKNIRFLNDVYPKDAEGDKSVADIADLMLPHLGASTQEANLNAARRAAEQIIDLDEKAVTSFIVNRDIPEGLDEEYCELANTLARICRSLAGRENTPIAIHTSIYGTLAPFADWLLVPMVAGIWDDFDRSMDFRSAREYLKEMGIEYANRDIEDKKGYDNSMTIDLTCSVDDEILKHMSIRGTMAEGNMMVSRINEYDKLYFEPVGETAIFLYDDRPGVVAAISGKLAAADINIEDIRHSHDKKTNRSLVIMRVNKTIPEELIKKIAAEVEARVAVRIDL